MRGVVEYASGVADLLDGLAIAVEERQLSLDDTAHGLRTLAYLMRCQGRDRDQLLAELGIGDGLAN